jgi:hypothetical protein
MHDPGDVVATAQVEERLAIGHVERLDAGAAWPGEERGQVGVAVPRDDDALAEIEEGPRGVRADHREPAGDEDHRSTW